MATYVAVDKDGDEYIFEQAMPYRQDDYWLPNYDKHGESYAFIYLPKGSIAKLIGKELTWDDEPHELKEV